LRAQGNLLLTEVEAGFLTLSQAMNVIDKTDREGNGGQPSAIGIQIAAGMPAAYALHALGASAGSTTSAPAPEAPKHDAAQPAAKAQSTLHPSQADHAPTSAPPIDDAGLQKLAGSLHDPRVDQIMRDLGAIVALDAKLEKKLAMSEIHGPDRERLVADIGSVRAQVLALDGLDPAALAAFKVGVNHKLEQVAPYHAQWNILTIESAPEKGQKRPFTTCNMTSLAMSLEAIGKNAASYKPELHAKLLVVANAFSGDIGTATLPSAGVSPTMDSLLGLRLPDFMELAAVVHLMKGNTEKDAHDAATAAVGKKTHLDFLAGIAGDFNAKADPEYMSFGSDAANKAFEKNSNEESKQANKVIDARKTAETSPHDKTAQAAYEQEKAAFDAQDATRSINQDLPLESYKSQIMKRIVPMLDAGAGIIAGCLNHFTRCYEMTNDYIMVQDPGQFSRSHLKIMWNEARAARYFTNYIVIR